MQEKIKENITQCMEWLEIVLAVLVLLACIVSTVGIVLNIDLPELFREPEYFREGLANLCFIIIGIELITLIKKQTLDSVLHVMMFAIAREMVVAETSPMEKLISVAAIGVLVLDREGQVPVRKKQQELELGRIRLKDEEAARKERQAREAEAVPEPERQG